MLPAVSMNGNTEGTSVEFGVNDVVVIIKEKDLNSSLQTAFFY